MDWSIPDRSTGINQGLTARIRIFEGIDKGSDSLYEHAP